MAEPYLGEIRMFSGNFAPVGWAFCDGQILFISQNTALFSLLGTNYGGDGRSTFALPNLQGSAPLCAGYGAGLTPRTVGESGGSNAVTLQLTELPGHSHAISASNAAATSTSPAHHVPAISQHNAYTPSLPTTYMSPNAIGLSGGGQPHNNMQPFLGVSFIIAMQGVYPPRS